MSTAEAELMALCAYAADVAYCRKIANELGFLQLRPTIIHDNLGAKAIAENGTLKGDLNTLSFDGVFFITTSTAALLESKLSSAIFSLPT